MGSKFAVEGLSDSMRLELADFGIQVAVIEPGPIKSDWAKISGEQLLEVSHDGPYQELSKQAAAFLQTLDAFGSQPEIIARKVVQAATARRPRTRYTAGVAAYASLLGRRILPDSALDAVLRQTGKLALKYQEHAEDED